MTTTQKTPRDTATTPRRRWRTIDVMVTVTIGLALGVAFLGLSYLYLLIDPLTAVFAPSAGILAALWFLPAVLAGVIVRRPGAALLAELIAAFVEMALGGQWGYTTMISGLAQGLGVEIGFALVAWRRAGIGTVALAGMAAAALEWAYEAFGTGATEWSMTWKLIYLGIMLVSGAILSPVLGLGLARALAATGVLSAFPIGRGRSAEGAV